MKRVLFSMVLLMAVSFSFAQIKNVKEAKSIANGEKPNFTQAEQLIQEAMKNPETKDLADTWATSHVSAKSFVSGFFIAS